MAWVRVDDAILDNPKIIAVGPLGFALHVAAISWSARNLTDGFVPEAKVEQLLTWHGVLEHLELASDAGQEFMTGAPVAPYGLVERLVAVRLWHPVDGGYIIHDFLEYNRSREQVLSERAQARQRKGKKSSPELRPNSARSSLPPVPVPVPGKEQKDLFVVPKTPRPKPTGHAKPQTAWPDNFTLSPERIANAQRVGADAAWEWDKFRDHHRAKGSRFVDWDAAWRTWLRNAVDFDLRRAP